jgi:glycosyltransferase involved in cell wall biosynthesis
VKILWVATKAPWPPADGGRLVAARTIEALAAAGHEVTVLTPSLGRAAVLPARPEIALEPVEARLNSLPWAALLAAARNAPVSVARHALPAVRARIDALLEERSFDVVHAEQAQALGQCAPAFDRGVPVVFRAQNVESDLWRGSAATGWKRVLARWQGARFSRWEGAAIRRVAATVALTAEDAARLSELAGGTQVDVVPAPAESLLPAADRPLPGDPALVLMGSSGWRPNLEGALWFLADVWPRVRAALPQARLHVFGLGLTQRPSPAVEFHQAPADSRDAFAPGAFLLVPVHLTSGVRMKILESWARGLPVVATSAAVAGLQVDDGRHLFVADDPSRFTEALARLHAEPALGPSLTAAGRAVLRTRHDPAVVAAALAAVYAGAAGTKKKS